MHIPWLAAGALIVYMIIGRCHESWRCCSETKEKYQTQTSMIAWALQQTVSASSSCNDDMIWYGMIGRGRLSCSARSTRSRRTHINITTTNRFQGYYFTTIHHYHHIRELCCMRFYHIYHWCMIANDRIKSTLYTRMVSVWNSSEKAGTYSLSLSLPHMHRYTINMRVYDCHRRYDEPCFWTLTKWKPRAFAHKPKAWGQLTWRGIAESKVREIPGTYYHHIPYTIPYVISYHTIP